MTKYVVVCTTRILKYQNSKYKTALLLYNRFLPSAKTSQFWQLKSTEYNNFLWELIFHINLNNSKSIQTYNLLCIFAKDWAIV